MTTSSLPCPPSAGTRGQELRVVAETSTAANVESVTTRLLRFVRAIVVGAGSTIADLATISLGVRVLHWDATVSRSLALAAGCLVLFFGYRSYAFRAQAGSIRRQALLFALSELLGFPLNLLIFRQLMALLPAFAPELLGLAANFLTFIVYYYPARRFVVFRVPSPPLGVTPGAARPR